MDLVNSLFSQGKVLEQYGERLRILFDEIVDDVPSETLCDVRLQIGEVAAGASTDVHIHLGSTFFLVVAGHVRVEDEFTAQEYRPGDVFQSPIATPHRDVNIGQEPLVAVALMLTPPGLPPIVSRSQADQWWRPAGPPPSA